MWTISTLGGVDVLKSPIVDDCHLGEWDGLERTNFGNLPL